MSYYTGEIQQFISLSLVETPSDDAYPTYVRQTVERKDLDYDIVFENDDSEPEDEDDPTMVSGQVMTSPIFAYLNITESTAVTHGIWGLTATDAIVPFPTDEDFVKYGLDDPFCTVTQITGGTDYVLKIGDVIYAKDEDGKDTTTPESYYCYIDAEGADAIFTIAADSLPWTSFMPEDVITGMMTYNYVYNVDNIVIDDDGTTHTIALNPDKPDQTIAPVLDDKDVDSDLFKTFYQFLMNCPTTEIYYQEPTGDKFMTISINLTNGGGDVMEIYTDTDRRAVVKLNGQTSFRIPTTYLDKLMENLQNLADGKEIDDTY